MSSTKRLVIVSAAHPYRGGIAAHTERLAREFQTQGWAVKIITFTLQYPSFLFPGKTQYSDSPAPADLTIVRSLHSVNPFTWLKVGWQLKKEQPDLMLYAFWMPFFGPAYGTIARIVGRNKFTKQLALLHNVIPHEKRLGDFRLTHYFFKAMQGFVSMAKAVLKDVDQFDTQKPRIFTPHPLYDNYGQMYPKDKARAALGISSHDKVLLFFGFIRDYKGLDWLLEAMADEQLKQMNVKLLVAGEFYTDSKPYLDSIAKHALQDRVFMHTDFIPDEKVGLYFSAADMVVQPYKHATQSGVTQIGYHFEKPMLVTNVGGLAEIVPHQKAGYVVEPNVKAIVQALVDFYQQQREEQFITGSAEQKRLFGWDVLVSAILKVANDC